MSPPKPSHYYPELLVADASVGALNPLVDLVSLES